MRYIEKPGIVRTVYLSIFRDIQQYLAMLTGIMMSDIEKPGIVRTVYLGIFRDIQQYLAMLTGFERKRIAIAKWDLFFHYRDVKEISFYYFCNTKCCAKHEKTGEFYLYWWDHVCKVNDWCSGGCFHRELRVSTLVREYCIAKSKMRQAFNGPLDHCFCDWNYLL